MSQHREWHAYPETKTPLQNKKILILTPETGNTAHRIDSHQRHNLGKKILGTISIIAPDDPSPMLSPGTYSSHYDFFLGIK